MPLLKKPSVSKASRTRKKVIHLTNPKDLFRKITFYHYGPSDRVRTCGLVVPNHPRYQLRYTRIKRPPQPCGGPITISFSGGSVNQSSRFLPQKNSATVPGPVWLPMTVPMELMSTLPSILGNRPSTRSATARASSIQAELDIYTLPV